MPDLTPLESAVLARGICSRVVRNINGLDAHVLESGHETHDSGEYERTGFQVGLQWYRSRTEGRFDSELQLFSGRTIDIPSLFIAGKSDWGDLPAPRKFRAHATERLHEDARLLSDRRRWPLVQQEQPERVSELLIEFLRGR